MNDVTEQEKAVDSKEDCDDSKGGKTGYGGGIPLVQLIKQLLKNGTSLILMRLLAIGGGEQKSDAPSSLPSREGSPSLNLLIKFQRLLIVQVYPTNGQDKAVSGK